MRHDETPPSRRGATLIYAHTMCRKYFSRNPAKIHGSKDLRDLMLSHASGVHARLRGGRSGAGDLTDSLADGRPTVR